MVTKLTLLLSLKGHLIFDATLSRERILVHSLNSSFNLHFGIWRFLANKIANILALLCKFRTILTETSLRFVYRFIETNYFFRYLFWVDFKSIAVWVNRSTKTTCQSLFSA